MRRIGRRDFIQRAAVASAALWGTRLWVPPFAGVARASSLDPAPFPFGVASGDPLADRVVIWTKVEPRGRGVVPVRWQVALDPDFARVAASGIGHTDESAHHTLSVDVAGLEPGSTYFYRFEAFGENSRVGRTKTAPDDVSSLVFAVASCQDFRAGHYAAWDHIASKNVDFVLHLGDYIYEGGDDGDDFRPHAPAREILTLADYRTRYANYRSDPALRAAHAAHPFICVWDDHEVANDRWKDGAENHQEGEGSYAARVEAGYRAYFEWMPIRRDAEDPDRVFRRFSFGDLVDLFMIDTRSHRDKQVGEFLRPNFDSRLDDPNRTILGDAQERWLHDGLAASRARWRLVGNQVMFSHLKIGYMPDDAARALQQLTGQPPKDGFPVNADQWDGYQFDRLQVLEHIQSDGIENVLFLTGDIHTSWAAEVYIEPDTPHPLSTPLAAEFVGPSITSSNLDEILGVPPRTASRAVEVAALANNAHIKYTELDSHGYVLVKVDKERAVGEWFFVEDKRNPRSPERPAASFFVSDGDSRVRPA